MLFGSTLPGHLLAKKKIPSTHALMVSQGISNPTAQPTGSDVWQNQPPPPSGIFFGRRSPQGQQQIAPRPTGPEHWTNEGFEQMRRASQISSPASQGGPLGGSMLQPFDYQAALEKLRGPQKKFGPWKMAAAALSDYMTGRNMMLPYMMHQKNAQERRNQGAQETLLDWRYKDFARQNEADLRASNPFTIGRARVQYDPASGQTQELYRGPQDFELYAQELGLQPGTDEYFQAVEDYVLRSSGPSAHDRDMSLDDHRTSNDESLENLRYGNRVGLENLRQGNRQGMVDYRNANPAPSRSRASGKRVDSDLPVAKTPAEARLLPSGTRFRTPDGQVKVVP